jgi:hypothetical protein
MEVGELNHSLEKMLLENDRQDLLELLLIRYGDVPLSVTEAIGTISDTNTLQRLILAAANAASWSVFIEELHSGEGSFKLVGERFSPF